MPANPACSDVRSSLPAMPALLLAGGLGTRLQPITDTIPKCLVPILNRPLLDIWIEKCLSANMDPIIINLSYLKEKVEEFLFSSKRYQDNKEKFLLLYEEELKGTGGTLLSAEQHLLGGTFFVAHADNLSFFSMEEFYSCHKNRPANCLVSAMSFITPTPETCGIFEIDDKGMVLAFHEKVSHPPGNLANGAVYFMEPPVIDILKKSANLKSDISLDLLPHCMGRMQSFPNLLYHRDIGNLSSYQIAQEDMKRGFSQYF